MSDATAEGGEDVAAGEGEGVYVTEESEITRKPTRTGILLSMGSGLVATLIALWFGFGLAAVLGLIVLLVGGVYGARELLDLGALLIFVDVVFAGVVTPTAVVLAATVAVVLAWDTANYGAIVGEQLGRESPTRRLEVVHAIGSLAVGAVSVGVGYIIFSLGASGLPATLVAIMLVAAAMIVAALRE